MLVYKISDSIVFNGLKKMQYGFIKITKTNGDILEFGNPNHNLKASIVIKNKNLTYNLCFMLIQDIEYYMYY